MVNKFKVMFMGEIAVAEKCSEATQLYEASRFGEVKSGKVQYGLVEAGYLLEKDKIEVIDGRGKKLNFDDFINKAKKSEHNFWIRYIVFRDMRDRGYIVKTALKFGADFRVYDRGIKPGEDHAKWVLYPVFEGEKSSWYEFSAKNRVAHSTRKSLLIGVVDVENSVTYYDVRWLKP